MRKLLMISLILALTSLCGCTHILKPYRPPVQQGNVITPEMTQKLKPGMSKMQIVEILGTPVLEDPFDQNTWNYVYTFQPSKGPLQQKQLIVYFVNERMTSYQIGLPAPSFQKRRR